MSEIFSSEERPTRARTPFKIAQSIDDVLQVMKRTGRLRKGLRVKGREGEFFINILGKRDKHVREEMNKLPVDLTQNLTIWYYLQDCTLKFKRYRGLDGKGANCYRIILISDPVSVENMESYSSQQPEPEPESESGPV